MSAFLIKWANSEPDRLSEPNPAPSTGETRVEPRQPHDVDFPNSVTWAEWKATMLNKLFLDQGTSGEGGRITAATVQHGARGGSREPQR